MFGRVGRLLLDAAEVSLLRVLDGLREDRLLLEGTRNSEVGLELYSMGEGLRFWVSPRASTWESSWSPMSSKWLASASTLSSSEGTEFNDEDLEDLECVKPGGELGPGRS
jgi:hypothetical protein